ncbi:MAG TPA: UDP-N-acetylmuramate--L-alanine ligase [Chitinophagaceae bacterium]|nr:UDP-N-acetylmuramate--L-alanine ligase [Chitinophagaceae bacterium]
MAQVNTIDELINHANGPAEVYFIGIGGIGMSALARYFLSKGCGVSGYDKTPTPLTRQLEQEGIGIHYEDNIALAPAQPQMVVYTPAIPANHSELNAYRQRGVDLLKRSQVLGLISKSSFNICVAGTHGKTTITTMIAHLLRDSGYGCNAFLGGIAVNYQTNFWSSERNTCVIEADEYDRSFLQLSPDIAIISSMDADHLDIYGTEENLQDAFVAFGARVKKDGVLIPKFGLSRGKDLVASRTITYSRQNESADAYAANVRMLNGGYQFDVMMKDSMVSGVELHMGGMHNVENAVAAITVAALLRIDRAKIKAAIASFKGIRRRFEYILPPAEGKPVTFIDDYAHHPAELKALITGAKALFAGRKCTVIFQPHLFSRTKDLADGFAESLDLADEVILMPIYPARELPMENVSSQIILDKMKNRHASIISKEDLLQHIEKNYLPGLVAGMPELLITAGAGDIDALVQPIKQLLEKK